MPPKPKYTKEKLVDTAVDLIRKNGYEAITARNLAKELNASAPSIFTHFSSMDELNDAIYLKAYDLFEKYMFNGLALKPAFKGFGMFFIKFVSDEPNLFKYLFMTKEVKSDLDSIINRIGHLDLVIKSIRETFELDQEQAYSLYEQLMVYTYGLSVLSVLGLYKYDEKDVANKLGIACRGNMWAIRNADNSITSIIPGEEFMVKFKNEKYK